MHPAITLLRDATPNPANLVWEEPPSRLIGSPLDPVADALRANPGQWAVVRTYPKDRARNAWNFATTIKQGKYAAFRPVGDFEAVARTTDGHVRVYVRYVPAAATR